MISRETEGIYVAVGSGNTVYASRTDSKEIVEEDLKLIILRI